jgi:hypothetical protein
MLFAVVVLLRLAETVACRIIMLKYEKRKVLCDMGPEGGNKGGKVMFEGTPKQLLHAKHSLTSEYLRS